MCVYVCVRKDNLQELGLTSHHVDPGDQTRVLRLGSKHLNPLSHLTGQWVHSHSVKLNPLGPTLLLNSKNITAFGFPGLRGKRQFWKLSVSFSLTWESWISKTAVLLKLDRRCTKQHLIERNPREGPHHSTHAPQLGTRRLTPLRAPRSPTDLTLTCMMFFYAPH